MEIRIDVTQSPTGPVLEVIGDLSGSHVALLLDECRTRDRRQLSLSLAGLVSADEVGVAALRLLQDSGVRIVDASPYFRLLLTKPAPAPNGPTA